MKILENTLVFKCYFKNVLNTEKIVLSKTSSLSKLR